MALGKVIGQVSVKVSPDTTGFSRTVKEKLRALKDETFKLKVEVDQDHLDRSIQKTIKETNARLLEEKNRIKFRTTLDIHEASMRRQVREARNIYQGMASATDAIEYDVDVKTAEALKPITQKVVVKVDENQVEKDVAEAVSEGIEKGATSDKSEQSFTEAMRRETKQWADIIDSAIGRKHYKIAVDLDKQNLGEIEKELRTFQEDLARHSGVQFASDADMEALRSAWRKQARDLKHMRQNLKEVLELGNTQVKMQWLSDIGEAEENLKHLRAEMNGLRTTQERVRIRLGLDESSIAETEARIEEFRERISGHEAKIDVGLRAAMAETRLAAMTAPAVKFVKVVVSGHKELLGKGKDFGKDVIGGFMYRSTGLRVVTDMVDELVRILPKLDAMVPQLASNTAKLSLVASNVAFAGASVLTLGGDLLKIANLGLALPAIGASLVAFGWSLYTGFRDFNKELPFVKQGFTEINALMGKAFWRTAKSEMTGFFKTAIPMLKQFMPEVSAATGDVVGGLARGTKRGLQEIGPEFFGNLAQGLKMSRAGFDLLGSAMTRLVGVGSRVLPDLGRWFSSAMSDFDAWTAKNARNGNIEKWVRQGAEALKDLGSVIWNTSGILRSLGEGAAELGISMDGLAKFTGKVNDAMKQQSFMEKYKSTLREIRGFLDEIGRVAGPSFLKAFENIWSQLGKAADTLAEPMAGLLKGIADGFNSPRMQNGITTFFEGIGSFLKDITPGMEDLVSEFGELIETVGVAAKTWGPAVNSVLEMVSSAGAKVDPGLRDFIENTGPALKDLVDGLRPDVDRLATSIGNLLANEGFQEFIRDLGGALESIGSFGLWVLDKLVRLITWLADAYNKLPDSWQKIISLGTALTGLGLFGGSIPIVGPVLSWVAPAIAGLLRSVATWMLFTVGPAVSRAITSAWGAIKWVFRLPGAGLVGAVLAAIVAGLVIADLIPADWYANNILFPIIDALIPGDMSAEMERMLREEIRKATGGRSLLDLAWDILTEGPATMTKNLNPGIRAFLDSFFDKIGLDINATSIPDMFRPLAVKLNTAFVGLGIKLLSWKPPKMAIDWGKKVWDWLFEGNRGDGGVRIPPILEPQHWLSLIVNWFSQLFFGVNLWKPISGAFDWAKKIWDWLFGKQNDTGRPEKPEPFEPGTWLDHLGTWWDELWSVLDAWTPGGFGSGGGDKGWTSKVGDWLFGAVDSFDPGGIVSHLDALSGPIIDGIGTGIDGIMSAIDSVTGDDGTGIGLDIPGILGFNEAGTRRLEQGSWDAIGALQRFGEQIGPALDPGRQAGKAVLDGLALDAGTASTNTGNNFLSGLSGFAPLAAVAAGSVAASAVASMHGDASPGGAATGATFATGLAAQAGAAAASAVSLAVGAVAAMTKDGTPAGAHTGSTYGSGLASQAGAAAGKAVSFASGVVKGLTKSGAPASNHTGVTYIGALASQGVSAVGRANGIGNQVVSGLRKTASGSGSFTGSTYTSAFSSAAQAAAGRAGGIAANVIGNLRKSGAPSGSFTGSSYTSALSAGAGRAAGIASSTSSRVVGNLRGNAYSSGSAIGSSFVSGLGAWVGAAAARATALVSAVRSRLPNSPAEEGPFSGSGWGGWGESIGEELARGLASTIPLVGAEAERMMTAASAALSGGLTADIGVNGTTGQTRGINALRASEEAVATARSYERPNVTVQVTSTADDPLMDGARLGRDLAFALQGEDL